MKLTAPYRCNYCDKLKGPANHWWLFWPTLGPVFQLSTWDTVSAERDPVEHICGQECAAKALAKWMAQRANAVSAQLVSTDQGSANP